MYESTLTLQRISSLLTDEGSQDREEEDDSPSSTTALTDCLEQTVTLDGASNPIFLNNLNQEALVELVLSVAGKLCLYLVCTFTFKACLKIITNLNSFLEGEDNAKKEVLSSKKLVNIGAASGAYTDENLPVHKRSEVVSLPVHNNQLRYLILIFFSLCFSSAAVTTTSQCPITRSWSVKPACHLKMVCVQSCQAEL